MWHVPFRVVELCGDHAVRLNIAGLTFQLFPVVHVSKLKMVKQNPTLPKRELAVEIRVRMDFIEAL